MTCSTPGCDRPLYVKELCSRCYQRIRSQKAREAKPAPLPVELQPKPRAAHLDIYSQAAYEADVAWNKQHTWIPEPTLGRLAYRLQTQLAALQEAGASDEEKLTTLRDLARKSLGARVDRPWESDTASTARESRRLTDSQLRDVAWTAPNGAERGWPC